MRTRVVLIHGVGPFDAAKAKRKLLPVLERFGLEQRGFEPFDWCRLVGDPFDNLPAVGNSILRLPFVNPSHEPPRGLRGLISYISDYSFLAAQICSLSFLPLALVASVFHSFPPMYLGLLLIVCFLFLGCVGEALTSRELRFRVCLRRTVFVLVWPLLHTIATPAYLRVWRILLAVVLPVGWLLGGGFALYALFNGGFWPAIGMDLAGFAVFAAIVAALYVAVRVTVYPILKVFSDVVRWLGDAEYRDKLRKALGDRIFGGGGLLQEETLVLATHSLGSVIGVDYLLSLDWKNRPGQTILITCGSPLDSLHKFIPELFCSPSVLCQRLQKNIAGFRWINVYRPFDPVGRRLEIDSSACAVENSTRQWHKWFLFAHIDYWQDAKVGASIQSALQGPVKHELVEELPDGHAFRWPRGKRINSYKPIVRFWQHGRQFSIAVFVAVLMAMGLFVIKDAKADQSDFYRLQTSGTKTVVEAICSPEIVREEGPSLKYRTDVVCDFSFKVPGRSEPVNGKRTTKNPVLPFEMYAPWKGGRAPVQACNVSLLYDEQKPQHFFVQSYQANATFTPFAPKTICSSLQTDDAPYGSGGIDWLWLLFPLLIVSGLTIVAWRYTGLRWSASLFGADADETWRSFYNLTIGLAFRDRS